MKIGKSKQIHFHLTVHEIQNVHYIFYHVLFKKALLYFIKEGEIVYFFVYCINIDWSSNNATGQSNDMNTGDQGVVVEFRDHRCSRPCTGSRSHGGSGFSKMENQAVLLPSPRLCHLPPPHTQVSVQTLKQSFQSSSPYLL